MHNHVLAEPSPAVVPGSDQSEDSDYESVWTAQSHRTASLSCKTCSNHITDGCLSAAGAASRVRSVLQHVLHVT